jgi:uncharacterized membrane protein (UPF0127 family)
MGKRLLLSVWLLLGNASHALAAAPPLRGFDQSTLSIESRSGMRHFSIYLAQSPAQQERGLMFVRKLPSGTGMLFPLPEPRRMVMWMKNTLISLDMLFIDAGGHIACVRARTVPESPDLISCDQPVSAVLEIGGGEAGKLGIASGDRVVMPKSSR